jgi:hypothetical protein
MSYSYKYYNQAPISIQWLKSHIDLGHDLKQGFPDVWMNALTFICQNTEITGEILKWLIENGYEQDLFKPDKWNACSITYLFLNNSLNIELFTLVINSIEKNDKWYILYEEDFMSHENQICQLFESKNFTPSMLKVLLEKNPNIDLVREDYWEFYPLYWLISNSNLKLVGEFLSIIYCYHNGNQMIPCKNLKYVSLDKLSCIVNAIAKYSQSANPNPNPAQLLIKISGQLFKLIEPQFITLEISNCFYNGNWFKTHPEEIKFIPEEFIPNLTKSGSKTKPGFRSGENQTA